MRIQIEKAYCGKKIDKKKIISIIILILLVIISILAIIFSKDEKLSSENVLDNNIVEEPVVEEPKQYIPTMTEQGIMNIKRIYNSDEKVAYLTFDDGPSIDVTALILDLLKEHNIKGTFFILGSQAEKYPKVLKRTYEEGHYIANHGYSHVYNKIYKSVQSVIDEYNATEKVIANAIGIENYQTYLFRFPGGSVGGYTKIKKEAKKILEQNHVASLDWNSLTRDSEGKFTKEQLFHNFKLTVRDQNSLVILFHDANGKILTYEVLKDIINYLIEEGYSFGDMKDLVQ